MNRGRHTGGVRPFRPIRLAAIAVVCSGWTAQAQNEDRLQAALTSVAPEAPVEVEVGVRVDQVVGINQKSENFEVVGVVRMQWDDPKLAFDAEAYGRPLKMFSRDALVAHIEEQGIFAPAFTLQNQQGRRFMQNSGAIIFPDGHVSYGERFTAQLQAPEFDFVRYPFDRQTFFVHVQAVYPSDHMRFIPLAEYSALGDRLGEEEWIFLKHWTRMDEVVGITGRPTSRFSFGFEACRHLDYYLLRIFLPLGIIIFVSWLSFFLQNFSKRVDIAGANLLIFIAFNFTISNDLPRLGYMTFMDAIVVATFLFSSLVVFVNVLFRRMEVKGKENLARRIDSYTLWIYPFTLLLLVLFCAYWFLARGTQP